MPTTPLDLLPYRLTERAFRRFELDIAEIVKRHPECTVLDPNKAGLAPRTYVPRLRDALCSLRKFSWRSTHINQEKFANIHDDIVISDNAVAGSRKAVREYRQATSKPVLPTAICSVVGDQVKTPVAVKDVNDAALICKMITQYWVYTPITGLTPDMATWLENSFDVVLTLNQDGSYQII